MSLPRVAIPAFASVLITISWALAVAAITSRFWIIRGDYDVSTDQPNLVAHFSRSPFSHCSRTPTDSHWNCVWTKRPGGLCDPTGGSLKDTAILCQLLKICGQLLIAGCVMLGISFLSSIGNIVLMMGNSSLRNVFSLCLFVATAAGAICMGLAALLGALALLVLQFPNVKASSSSGDPADILDVWTGHSGFTLANASWIMALLGAFFLVIALQAHRQKRHERNTVSGEEPKTSL